MINVSEQFKLDIQKNTKVILRANLEFPLTQTIIPVESKYFKHGSAKFEDSTSSSGSFDIGAAIINQFSATLNNVDEFFDGLDLNGAVFCPQVGKILSDGTTEWVNKGAFTVDNPVSPGKTISITALDNMHKFEIPYSKVLTVYPATLGQIVRDMALYCGVQMASGTFDNDDYVVQERPDDSTLTCIKMLSYVAQISGNFARCNNLGQLEIKWYEETDSALADHQISKFSSINVYTNDIIITGIKVTDSGDEQSEYLFGSEDYVLSIDSNPLIESGKAKEIAEYLGAKIVGMKFRPLDCSCLANPAVEAGDSVCVTDRYGKEYFCYLTNVNYTIGSYMRVSCEAKTPSSNRATPFSNETKAIAIARKEAEKKIEIYNSAMQQLTSLMAQSFGVFKTEEILSDGSVVYYMHDKQTLETSEKIWKMTADAFAVSNDGGQTWNAGLDTNGNAVVNILSAIGVRADWIQTGAFSVVDDNGNTIFKADKDTGQITMSIKNDDKGILNGVVDKTNFNIAYTDANEIVMSGMRFNFETGQFEYDGDIIAGSININGKFVVDSQGNAELHSAKFYSSDGEVAMNLDSDGLNLYDGQTFFPIARLGYALENGEKFPLLLFWANGSNDLRKITVIRQFYDGTWIGNVNVTGSGGYFQTAEGANGLFVDHDEGNVYCIKGDEKRVVYTGEAIAKFG